MGQRDASHLSRVFACIEIMSCDGTMRVIVQWEISLASKSCTLLPVSTPFEVWHIFRENIKPFLRVLLSLGNFSYLKILTSPSPFSSISLSLSLFKVSPIHKTLYFNTRKLHTCKSELLNLFVIDVMPHNQTDHV